MATYTIHTSGGLTPSGFFPITDSIDSIVFDGGKEYTFSVSSETRKLKVYWAPGTLQINSIGLFTAEGDPIAEIIDVAIDADQLEHLWFNTASNSADVFSLVFGADDQLSGSDGEDTFVPGLGNDEVSGGGNNGLNDFDYVNYGSDARTHGVFVDLIDGNASDHQGRVTSRGGTPETDILHSVNGIYATAFEDILVGDLHDNEFYGGFGNDTMHGGGGSRFDLISYSGTEVRTGGIIAVFTAEGTGTVQGTESVAETDTFTGIEAVHGTNFDDSFIGSDGFQRFRGFLGDDTFDGGAGNDEVDYRNDFRGTSMGVTVDLSQVIDGEVIVVMGNGDKDTLIDIEYIRGTRQDDRITGSNEHNRLRGDSGNDTLSGLDGDDRLEGNAGNDSIDGDGGHDTILGDDGNDTLIGGDGSNTIMGGNGDDSIIGGAHDNFIEAGAGNDTIDGGGAGDSAFATLNYAAGAVTGIRVEFSSIGRAGTVVNDGRAGTDIFTNIDAVTGTVFDDVFIGGSGAGSQRFVGLGGNDTFDGSLGVNEVDYRTEARATNRTQGMIIDLSGGLETTVTDATGGTDTLIRIERIRGTEFGDTIIGNQLDNRLRGDAGNDNLDGGDGNDRIEGGLGDDLILGGLGNDTILGGNNDGSDSFDSFNEISYKNLSSGAITVTFAGTPGAGTVEKAGGGTDTFSGINSIFGTGFADTFIGGNGAWPQRFAGLGGNDKFDGTLGINEVDYRGDARVAGRTSGMTIDISGGLQTTVKDATGGTDTLINIERIRGTEHADRIVGNQLDNRLRGDAGNDVLKGAIGNDRLEGGAGADTVELSGSRSDYTVVRNFDGTIAITDRIAGRDGQDTILDVEFFSFAGSTLSLFDMLNNGTGIKLADGVVLENSASGQSAGTLSVTNPDGSSRHTFQLLDDAGGRFQLSSDNKTLQVAKGNLLDFEQSQFHTVRVRATDQFGKSVDAALTVSVQDIAKETVTGTTGNDVVSGGSGIDSIAGGAGADILNAGAGEDVLSGGIGNDRLIGGAGVDKLTGGTGKDVFAFSSKDTGASKKTADLITDFVGKSGDKIDLKAIDASPKKRGDQAFKFIGKEEFSAIGQVRYEKVGKETHVFFNTDADSAAEGMIRLQGAMDLQKTWFVL